jgi:hypothetical protein
MREYDCRHHINQLYVAYCDLCNSDEVVCDCGGILGLMWWDKYKTLEEWYYDEENKDSPQWI